MSNAIETRPQMGQWWCEQESNVFHRLYIVCGGSSTRIAWHTDCVQVMYPFLKAEEAEHGILCKNCWGTIERFGDEHDRASIPLQLPMPPD